MYQNTAKGLAALGRNGDSMLMHVNPQEVAALSKILGPTTTNPKTGLPEAYGWSNLLGSALTGMGSFGVGAALNPVINEALGGVTGDLMKEAVGKAVPALAGAGLGAAIGGATGGKAGALGGALQGGMSGGLGAFAAEDVLGAPDYTTPTVADKSSPDFVGPRPEQAGPIPQTTTDAGPHTAYTKVPSSFTDNLGKLGQGGLNKYEDYVPYLFQAGMIGNAVTSEQESKNSAQQAEEDARRRMFLTDLQATNLARSTYGYAGGGYVAQSSDEIIKQMLSNGPSMYGSQEHRLDKRPLNVQNLIDAGAMRITYPGDGTGSYDPNLEGYSIVSRINDVGDPMTRGWPDKPDDYGKAAKDLSNPDMIKQLSDAKYKQLIDSAAAAGLSPKDIYSGYAGGGPVIMQSNNGVPVQVRIPEHLVDKVKSAGGMPAYMQGLGSYANGGYVNTQPFEPQHFYPQSQIPSARPYAGAAPTSVIDTLHEGASFAEGGLLDGEGDGMSDDIDANIEGQEPIRVADGEFIVPKHIVDMIGVDRLDDLLRSVRRAAYGREEQINEDAGLEAAKRELGIT